MIKAVLFDLDGTLYRQSRLRLMMAGELATVPWFQHAPWRVSRVWRMLQTFRHVREELRVLGRPAEPLERLQYTLAAERAGVAVGEMEAVVREWIFTRPLKYLRQVVRPHTDEVLGGLRDRGLRLGVFSDYPAVDKLKAMGLEQRFGMTLEATETDVNAFKPHPRGFLVAADRWGLSPADVLYVGDRAEVDAVGAAAAGMPAVVIGSDAPAPADGRFVIVPGMRELFDRVTSVAGGQS